ncbi:MAG TPA: hypothetical protein VK986_12730 [Tepidisphaeraceae bacterium]|nr:hypothetical protein [Tepidisphaeraceae bacterium]
MRPTTWIVTALIAISAIPSFAADPPEHPLTPTELTAALADLARPNDDARAAASKALARADRSSLPPLRAALTQSNDADQSGRIREAISIAVRADPSLSPDAREIVLRHLLATRPTRLHLMIMGRGDDRESAEADAGWYLWELETDPQRRAELSRELVRDVPRRVQRLVGAGRPGEAITLLDAHIPSGKYAKYEELPHAITYAAAGRAAGALPRLIAAELAKPADAPARAFRLTCLYRAAGDLDAALKNARELLDRSLAEAILAQKGDWPALAALDLPGRIPERSALVTVAALDWAGDHAAADRAYEKFDALPDVASQVQYLGQRVLMIGRHAEALALLAGPQLSFDTMRHLGNLRRYDDVIGRVHPRGGGGAGEALAAVCYAELGDAADVDKIIARMGDTPAEPGWSLPYLAEAEHRLGRLAAVEARVRRAAVAPEHVDVFNGLVPLSKGGRVDALLRALNTEPAKPSPDVAAAVYHWTRGALPAGQWKTLLVAARDHHLAAAKGDARKAERSLRCLALIADALRDVSPEAATATDAALLELLRASPRVHYQKVYNDFADDDPFVLAPARRDWPRARALYEVIAAGPNADPVFRFLYAVALERTGDPARGAALRTAVDAALLADAGKRYALAQARAAADLSKPKDESVRQALDLLARDAFDHAEYVAALAFQRRSVVERIYYMHMPEDTTAYVRVPHFIAECRARVAIAAGQWDVALTATRDALALDPESLQLSADLITAAGKANRNDTADAALTATRAHYDAVLKAHPNATRLQADLSWLLTATARHPDEANRLLARARELAPESPAVLAADAELAFNRSDRPAALAAIDRAIKLAPDEARYRSQCARYAKQ